MPKFIILDGNSIMNRAFYGLSGRNMLSTKDGFYTNALYGFMNILIKILNEEKPTNIAVAFDLKAPTFRHKIYTEYKGQRKPTPVELINQMPVIKEILKYMNILTIEKEGYEADDIIGTLAKRFANQNANVQIISGDRDGIQLVDEKITLNFTTTKAGKPELEVYDIEHVKAKYGLMPIQMIDVKSLMGDTSDNIPGVPGIGEKTALELIQKYKNIEEIYNDIEKIDTKDRIKKLLEENKELAKMSKQLATINTEVPIQTTLEDCIIKEFNKEELLPLLQKLEFNSIIAKLEITENEKPKATINIKCKQLTKTENISECSYYIISNKNKDIIEMSICDQNEELYYTEDMDKIREIFENENIKKYTFNTKADLYLLKKAQISPKNIVFDIMLAEYIIDPKNISDDISVTIKEELELDVLTKKDLNEIILKIENGQVQQQMDLFGTTVQTKIDENAKEEIKNISSKYAYSIFKIAKKLETKIKETNQENLYYDIELPLVQVLYSMEKAGFSIDKKELDTLGELFEKRLNELTEDITKLAGEEFNINSTKQLGVILFEKLALPIKRKTKTGYSTDVEVLEELYELHPIIGLILEYRQLNKLKSTYIDGMKILINPTTNKIHSTFNQMITTTGRLSSTEPNLQNIPVKYEMGKQIRKAFIPSQGCILISADYSQIELRVLAHITNDKNMIEAFKNKKDIHTITASKIFGVPEEQVTSNMRSSAKAINFGIIYGKGEFSLAKDLNISRKQAKEYIEEYLNQYSNIKKYMTDIVETAKNQGYVETLFGRRRYLKDINSSNFAIRASAERMALNAPIQGTAADIIKIAMIKVYNEIKKRNLKSKLILQVHDELIIDTKKEEKEEIIDILKQCMENAITLKIPLDISLGIGENWMEAK